MPKVYLFDWGDTLMVDFPDQKGKMCDWETVQAVDGAREALKHLSESCSIYVATNAADSSEQDIKLAFERVGLDQYIDGYFCKANLGIGKGSPEFFHKIVQQLGVSYHDVVMVGDNYDNDIGPAIEAGINAVWLDTNSGPFNQKGKVRKISKLTALSTSDNGHSIQS